jgi:excisionase family DNA binding protein
VSGISFRDVHGIADELGVDVQTVRRWIQSGRLRAFKPGKEYRVREADLDEFLADREVLPKAPSAPLSFSLWLEERFGHSYLALSEEQIEELFEDLSGREDEEERKRELFSAITAEYLGTAKTRNLPAEDRVLVRGHHKDAANKWWLAATASGLAEGVTEEFERSIKEVLAATAERETA